MGAAPASPVRWTPCEPTATRSPFPQLQPEQECTSPLSTPISISRGRRPVIGSSDRHHDYAPSLEADNLNLLAAARRQTQHIADLEARLSELLGEQAYSRTGLGAPRNHAALEEQNHTLQNEIQELQAKLQGQEEELGAAREANRQLIGQLNKPAATESLNI